MPMHMPALLRAALARSLRPLAALANHSRQAVGARKVAGVFPALLAGLSLLALAPSARAAIVHPGALSTQADLDRMAAKVAAGEQPWKGGWDILVGNEGFYMGGPEAVPILFVDSGNGGNTYMSLARDSHRAYQAALRYQGSGETKYADQAVRIMNAWATTHTSWDGNSNVFLRMGLYGYAFACAGELLSGYDGWDPADFAAFQQYMRDQFYEGSSWWIGAQTNSHYWANWTLANMDAVLAIGVLCDDQAIIDEALNHFYNGVHTGAIENAVYHVHPNGLGQWQESGRDQGHAQIGPQLLGVFCEIAWNQGYDLYGYLNNRVLAGVEYISKYNTGHAVPFVAYSNSDYAIWPNTYRFYQKEVAGPGGVSRPGWDLIYNHYVNRMGIAAPYTAKYAAATRPEGGGSNYGGNSGGFDGLGFTTLTHSRDPIAVGALPSSLIPYVQGRQVTLSWTGSAYAQSYNVKRSATSGGPYTTLGTVDGDSLFYVDPGLTAGATYYYVVSANNPDGESADSAEASATADGQLFGTVIGTNGSWDHAGATKEILFDGSLKNFIDIGGSGGGWAGLDLGSDAVINGIRYCPRENFPNSMVGGKFQASNTADFSAGVVDLFTITTAPTEGVLTFQAVNSGSAYRYVRYIQPTGSGWNTAADVQFLGTVGSQDIPSAPLVNVAVFNGLQIDLTWNAVPGATGYRIKRSTSPGGPYLIYGDVNTGYGETTKFSDVETGRDATYYYIVSAYNQFGESAGSVEISHATLPTAPQLMARLQMSGDVADSSGHNFQANAFGAPTYATGHVGSAIDLDGTDDFVMLPARVVDSEDITVAAWVRWDGGAPWQRIFDFGAGTWAYLYLTPSSTNGTLRFGIKNGSEQFVEAPGLAAGTWAHVAVTLGGDTATIYVNGSAVASSSTITINPSDFRPGANFIGKSQWAGDALFNGRIDEFRVYNHALSAGSVAALAALTPETTPPAAPTGLSATAGDGAVDLDWANNSESDFASYTVQRSTTSGSGYGVIASGLTTSAYTDNTGAKGVTYYYRVTAVDTSGGESAASSEIQATPQGRALVHLQLEDNALDGSGNGHHATVTGSPTYAAGQLGQAVDLNGSADYLRIPSGVIGGVDNMTIATWVNWDGGANWQRIFDLGDGTARYLFLSPSAGTGKLRVAINNGGGEKIVETTTALATGTWVHLAVTLSGDTTTLYVNGTAVANTVAAINPTGFDFRPVNNYLGKSQFGSDPLFNGRIDDFRIYGYALPASQINDVMQGGDTLPPLAPTDLTTTPGSGQVDLSWTASAGATSYTILRATSANGPYTTLATGVTGTSYADTSALPGWTYHYAVSAGNSAGEGEASASAATTTAAVAISWLKLDETSGTTAADATGNNNAGTLVNAPAWIGGTTGNALNLNGTNQYATLPNGITSNLHDFTVSTWVYWNGGGNWQRVFDFGSGTSTYMFLTPTYGASGVLRFAITTSGGGGEQRINGNAALTTGTWNHVAVTLSGSTGTLYVNGQQVGQNTAMTLRPSDLGATTQNRIGRSQYNDPYFNGRVDDFRLYAGALSASQIAALAAPIQTTGLAATGGSAQIALTWNATSGATSYTVRRASTSGGAYTTVASGLTGTSYTHTGLAAGTTCYYVVTPAAASGDGANSAEASAITTPAAPGNVTATPGSGQVALSWSASTGATGYNVLRATSPGGSYTTIATGVVNTHYTDTGLANGTTYYYVVAATNGSGSSANSTQVNALTAPPAPADLVAIGWNGAVDLGWPPASGATSYSVKRATTSGGAYTTLASGVASPAYSDTTAVDGTTYYYVVSASNAGGESANSAEASTTFTQPLVHLKFDETSGTSAADSSGNGWTGTLVNGPLWSAGRSNNTVDLDGANDHVTLPTGVVNGLTNCTITLWANLDSISNWSRLFDFGTGTTVNMFLTPKNGANNRIRFAITTGGGGAEQRIDGTSALPIGGWHHVAVTLAGSTGTLYVDGVQVGQNTAMTLTPSSLGSTTQNRIGRSQYNDPYLMGRIDEFRIYGRALSATEVASLMNTSPAGLMPAPAALTATPGTGQVVLNWSAVTGATSYDVLRSTTSGGPFLDVATGLTTTTYADTGLTAGTTYHYVIVARTATSESPNSPVASATAQ